MVSHSATTKQKILSPTLKERQRYVVYEVLSTSPVPMRQFHEYAMSACKDMLGLFDGAGAGLLSVKYDEKTHRGIIRVNNQFVDKLKVCLGLIKDFRIGQAVISCTIKIVFVSGLMNKAKTKMEG